MKNDIIKWHPGFYGGLELELKDYKDYLKFESEYYLSKEPLKIDMLIIEKISDVKIDNQICHIFKKHNIIEYKSPTDGLTIDDYYKTLGYAYLYKGLGKTVDEIPLNELTVTLVRDKYPDKLIKTITKYGGSVNNVYPGIYYISGLVNTPSQIVVTSELDSKLHSVLKLLSDNVQKRDLLYFINNTKYYETPGDRNNANAVLQVSSTANKSLFDEIRRDKKMCQALMEIMHEEVQQECDKAAKESSIATIRMNIKSLMKNMHLTAEQAMDALNIPASERSLYL